MGLNRKPHDMISYAGNREDVLLARAFCDRSGFYVDVGANDPDRGSTTKYLHDKGWRGINIEPNPALFERIIRARPLDLNVCALVSEVTGTVPFYIIEDDPALSTMDEELANLYRAAGRAVRLVKVRSAPLNELLRTHAQEVDIDLLKVDAEGAEERVLRSVDLCHWRPKVLIVEAIQPSSLAHTHSGWDPLVREQGYTFCLFDGINRIYARKDQTQLAERLSWPVCALDHYITTDDLELSEYRKLGRVSRAVARLTQRIVSARPRWPGPPSQ